MVDSFGFSFKAIDTRSFALPGTQGRFWHIASITYGVREFMYFIDRLTSKTYIEEITGGHLELIEDDSLWEALTNFVAEKGLSTFKISEA